MESMQKPKEFRVKGIKRAGIQTPNFDSPKVIGCYSLDWERKKCSSDLSQLKYCQTSISIEDPIDLAKLDLDRFTSYYGKSEKLDRLLEWILSNFNDIQAADEKRWLPQFVCYRGLLTTLWSTPCKRNQGWLIDACMLKKTIYLNGPIKTEYKPINWSYKKDINRNAHAIEVMLRDGTEYGHRGIKVERYIVSETPDTPPRIKEPGDKGEFNCVFRSRLGKHELLYGARMDAVSSKELLTDPAKLNEQKFVKLQNSKKILEDPQKFLLLYSQWWSQCSLVGIEDVLCGCVDNNGFLQEVRNIKVADMPHLAQALRPDLQWQPEGMQNFCDKFLDWVKSVVVKDYKKAIYQFTYHPVAGRIPDRQAGKILARELSADSEYAFLPEWFTENAEQSKHE